MTSASFALRLRRPPSRIGRQVLTTVCGLLAAAISLVAGPPSSGTTTFGTGGNDQPLASGGGNSGVTAANVRGTGWDIRVTTTTPTNIHIAAGDLFYGTGDGIYYTDNALDGEPLAAWRVSANDSSIFDLQSFQFSATDGNDGTGTLWLRVTGYRSGSPVSGATADFSITGTGGNYPLQTVTVSGDPDFVGIDAFVITPNGGEDIHFFALDNLAAANVRQPNVAPIISSLHGDSVSYVEGASAVALDAFANATVTDTDSPTFNDGALTVSIVTNRVDGEDVLSVASGGSFTISGSNLQSGGLTFATVAGGTGSTPLVVSFTASGTNATLALVQEVVRHLTYRNSNAATPSTMTRTVRVVVTDGEGGTSNTSDVSVGVTGVNDPPTLSATGGSPTFTEGGAAADLYSSVAVSTVEAGQAITGLTLTVAGLADGSNERLHVDGTEVVLSNGATGATTGNAMLYAVSVVGSTATVSLAKAAGLSSANAQTLVDGLAYGNVSGNPTTSHRVVTLTSLTDSGGTDNGGVDTTTTAVAATVSVAATNDAPVVMTSGGTTAFTEAANGVSTPVAVDPGLTVNDVDSSTLAAAAVAITGNFAAGQDVLSFTNDGSTMGNLSASYNAGTGVMALTSAGATATIAQWQAALRAVHYANSSDTPASAARTVSFTVNDGSDGSIAATKSISVAPTNDAPVVTAPSSVTVTEDSASPLTGISFNDVDAASGSVTATLSVPSGSLSATGGGGVTVGGSISALTLTGTIANLNAFIASSQVTYTTATNATAAVTLSASIDDGGNSGADPGTTGTASSEADSTTVTLTVNAVNDAPVNTVPAAQTIAVDTNLAFSTLNGTLIAVSDEDLGGNDLRITLTSSHGLLTLATTSGLAFTVGSGTSDATMTFTGTLADVNAALNGAIFTPTPSYTGVAIVQVTSDDQGSSGSGGAQTDTDTVHITVAPGAPAVTSITSLSPNGTYKAGDTITLAVSFDQSVHVDTGGGTPILLLETGGIDRAASYTSGTCSTTLIFTYTVQAGDASADLDIQSAAALSLNGGTIEGSSGDAVVLTLPAPGSGASLAGQSAVVVDTLGPAVTGVTAPANGSYGAGQALDVTVQFSEPVVVASIGGVPAVSVALDAGGPASAAYVAGSGTTSLVFRAHVQPGQRDADGIVIGTLTAGGATLRDAVGNDATLTLVGVPATTGVLVDTDAPGVTIGAPSVTSTSSGPVSFVLTYTGATAVTLSPGDVTLQTSGSATATVAVSGSGTSTRTVTLSAISGSGTLAITIAAHTASDAAGNPALAAGPSASLQVLGRQLTSLSPTSGLADGGVAVTMAGVGFTSLQTPTIQFGLMAATQVVVVSDTELRAVTPALPAGTALDVVLADAGSVVSTLSAAYHPVASPDSPSVDTDADGMPDQWELRFGLDPLDAADATRDTDGDGMTNMAELAAGTHPLATWRRAFAEGVVTEAFRTELSLFNPGLERASVVVRYLPEGAAPVTDVIEIAPGRAEQRDVALVANLPRGAVAMEFDANVAIVVSSLTSWDGAAYGAGAEAAVEPAATWYLAEGATHGPFDLFYLVANPNPAPVDVDVTFLRPAPAPPLVRRYSVAAQSRTTLWVDVIDPELAATDVSAIVRAVGGAPIVVERAMYAHDGSSRFGPAGHRAAGVSQPADTWHLAEGYVGGPFDTYVLVANPNTAPAVVTVDVTGESGVEHTQTHEVAAGARLTLYAGDVPVTPGPVAFTVRTDPSTPIVVERAMWWRAVPGGPWVESHASAGATIGAQRWGITDVRLGGARSEAQYLLLQNVDVTPVTVDVTLYLDDGTTALRSYVVGAAARLTVDLGGSFPEAAGRVSSAVVTSSGLVVVEASRYWDAEGVRWAAGANVRATPLP